jgi:hypothetical protein
MEEIKKEKIYFVLTDGSGNYFQRWQTEETGFELMNFGFSPVRIILTNIPSFAEKFPSKEELLSKVDNWLSEENKEQLRKAGLTRIAKIVERTTEEIVSSDLL